MAEERGQEGRRAGATSAGGEDGARAGRLGFVAHEVRNPLSTALWTAELLSRMAAADRAGARGDKMAAMLVRSLGRVRQLVEDHFLSERLDVGGIPLRPEAHGLRAALETVAGMKAADVGAVTAGLDEAVVVLADGALLERALEAIVAAAGRDGAAVSATARRDGGRWVLRVAGGPVAEEALADPAKGAPSDPKGRALALPLARRIAAVLSGELRVAGGALELTLPAAPAPPAGPGDAAGDVG